MHNINQLLHFASFRRIKYEPIYDNKTNTQKVNQYISKRFLLFFYDSEEKHSRVIDIRSNQIIPKENVNEFVLIFI